MSNSSTAAKADEIISTLLADSMGWKTGNTELSAWHTASGQYLLAKSDWIPTSNIAQAFHIVDYLNQKGFLIGVFQHIPGEFIVNVISKSGIMNGGSSYKGRKLPLLICKAALSVLCNK